MFRLDSLLSCYLRVLRQVSGARAASLFLPAAAAVRTDPVLLHDGPLPPLPELVDADHAELFARRADETLKQDRGSSDSAIVQLLPSESPAGRLVRIPTSRALPALLGAALSGGFPSQPGELLEVQRLFLLNGSPPMWLGLRGDDEGTDALRLDHELEAAATGQPCDAAEGWGFWILLLGGTLVAQNQEIWSTLYDPVTGLPGRIELQNMLRSAVDGITRGGRHLALMLVNPTDFAAVNRRFGRAAGDQVLSEIAERLRATLGMGGFPSRYGGAIFAVLLPNLPLREAAGVAERVREALTEQAYLDGQLHLGAAIGVAALEPSEGEGGDDAAYELIRRADQSLGMARLSGGNRIVARTEDSDHPGVEEARDRLRGIFTANPSKDYRNMLLIWDTVAIVSARLPLQELAARVLERLVATFGPERAGIFRFAAEGAPQLLAAAEGLGGLPSRLGELPLGEEQRRLLEQARASQHVAEVMPSDGSAPGSPGSLYWCALPLTASGRCLGALLLGGGGDRLVLDSSDLMFLIALGGEVATALNRATREEEEKRAREHEQRVLRTEVAELRRALREAKLVYRSPEMAALLETARRIALTDATVLVTGSSGTGKELVARTIHELSSRRERKPVVVDCSAISASLIDSELFGHERGAFTGADRTVAGRLEEADGSTVILDEIGELPLESQSKLLRFVQEKQLTRVGGTKAVRLDVRIVAVTNRDLAAEVAAGRFREDLYHRLNVFHLRIPPLRERPDDIKLLAEYFVKKYALQYQKSLGALSPAAEEALLAHPWPGNVRELENRILQAVILGEGERLEVEDLNLDRSDTAPVSGREGAPPAVVQPLEAPPLPPTSPEPEGSSGGAAPSLDEVLDSLRLLLRGHVAQALDPPTHQLMPLGRWLDDDLVLQAYAAAGEVTSRAAELTGIPESTFRRRRRKAAAKVEAGLAPRPRDWEAVVRLLAGLFKVPRPPGTDLLAVTRRLLLEEVRAAVGDKPVAAAALMGVTEPTLHRWVDRLDA